MSWPRSLWHVEEPGIKIPVDQLVDNLLYHLSHSHLDSYAEVGTSACVVDFATNLNILWPVVLEFTTYLWYAVKSCDKLCRQEGKVDSWETFKMSCGVVRVVNGRKEGGNNRLIDGPGRTWGLTNGKPRWQNGPKDLKGRTVSHRWMGRVSCCLTNVSQACSSIPSQN